MTESLKSAPTQRLAVGRLGLTSTPNWAAARRHGPAILVFVFCSLLSVAISLVIWQRQVLHAREGVDQRLSRIALNVESSFALPMEAIHGLVALFHSTPNVSRDQFHAFIRPALKRHPSVYVFEWLPYVKHKDRAKIEQRGRAEGIPHYEFVKILTDGTMVRAPKREAYLPILYMQPVVERSLFGFDSLSHFGEDENFRRMRDTASLVVTERTHLVEDPPDVYSIAVLHGVYRGGIPATVEARRKNFMGMVNVLFRVRPLIEHALVGADVTGLDVVLIDTTAPPDKQLLYESTRGIAALMAQRQTTWEKRITFGAREWLLQFTTRSLFEKGNFPWLVLALGLGVSAFFSLAVSAFRTMKELRRRVQKSQELGQYRLVESLGSGGMGIVFRAQHAMLRRPTAIKLLSPKNFSPVGIERFEREVQLTAQLTHPNTVDVYDYGRSVDGVLYYAMEYIEGLTFQHLVDYEGPQPVGRVIHLMRQVCGALAEAHDKGIIHRDIKPSNLMVTRLGDVPDFVKVFDFGLVKDLSNDDMDLTVGDKFIGTPLYAAPELISDVRNADARSDMYSLGVVAYYMLSSHHVFVAANPTALLAKHASEEPLPVSAMSQAPIPGALEEWVMTCLHKDPKDRPTSIRWMEERLEEMAAVHPWTRVQAQAWWVDQGEEILEALKRNRPRQRAVPQELLHKVAEAGMAAGRGIKLPEG